MVLLVVIFLALQPVMNETKPFDAEALLDLFRQPIQEPIFLHGITFWQTNPGPVYRFLNAVAITAFTYALSFGLLNVRVDRLRCSLQHHEAALHTGGVDLSLPTSTTRLGVLCVLLMHGWAHPK